MKKKTITFRSVFAMAALVGLLVGPLAHAAERPDKRGQDNTASLNKPNGEPRYQILNINNLWTWVRNDGQSNHSPSGDNGTYFPRGTKWFIYQDGLIWGGKAYSDAGLTQPAPFSQLTRVGGATYGTGCREGWINGTGATAARVDPADAGARVYRIRRDYASMSDQELNRDAAEVNELSAGVAASSTQMQTVRDRYAKDWAEWPVALGAPYIERNGTPGYQAPPAFDANFTFNDLIAGNYDEPGLAGADPNSPADQVMWTVYNDLDAERSKGLYGSEPLGLEAQVTIWGYKRSDALGNIFFKKLRIINKGGVAIDASGTKGAFWIDSMYVAQWSDPDLGNAGDDLVGCDTTLSIGYVYNGNAIDLEYRQFNLAPPSAGYDFLQGPKVPSPGDSAVFDLKRVHGFKNLGLTSFAYFSAGSPISDPPGNYEQGTGRWYKMLKGFAPKDGANEFYPFPPGLTPDKYPLSGDPVTGAGFIDGIGADYSLPPGDRRIVNNTGPFSLAPGDTQEVVVALVGGLGADRLSSIAVMKFNDRFAQNTYDALFQVPRAPTAPNVKVTELDGEVILEWGSDLAKVTDTENKINQPGSFAFEGYNIYQLPRRSSSLSDGKRIATFDLASDPTVILDEQFDVNSGQVLSQPVQFGSNSGIVRYFKFDRDYVLDIDRLNNGQEYYLVVTAYSHSKVEGFLPTALESDVQVITVTPKIPFGTQYTAQFGDTLEVVHTSVGSASDGVVTPIVVDPKAGTGDTYEVRFDTTGGNLTWKLVNKTKGTSVLTGQTNQSGDGNYKIVEGGLYLQVTGPTTPGVKDWDWTAGSRFLTWAGGAGGFGFESFEGALGWYSPRAAFGDGAMLVGSDQLKKIELRFANVTAADGSFDVNQDHVSYGYRYLRGSTGAPAKPEFQQYILNPGSGYAYQAFEKNVPLAAYDMDVNPPRRLALGFLENNQPGGLVDGKYFPPFYNDADNTAGGGPREWLFVFDADYSEAPDPVYQVDIISGDQRTMYWATWARRNTNNWTDADVMEIVPNRLNSVNDVFTYSSPAPVVSAALQQASAEHVGAFPNPYYAFNPAEENRVNRFVTINNLPPQATIRIFSLAGQLVRKIDKDNTSQFQRWDLLNFSGLPVASGMYIVHVDMPGIGTKVLKLAVIQEQEVLETF